MNKRDCSHLERRELSEVLTKSFVDSCVRGGGKKKLGQGARKRHKSISGYSGLAVDDDLCRESNLREGVVPHYVDSRRVRGWWEVIHAIN